MINYQLESSLRNLGQEIEQSIKNLAIPESIIVYDGTNSKSLYMYILDLENRIKELETKIFNLQQR